tara:strand:+ start:4105 stop:4818 length:714 start_codon:yes stop_codon:yes gene_type:complete
MTSLKSKDLQHYVNEIFTIDNFKSKMGRDEDVSVLAFEVTDQEPAKDLMNFIEKGYASVLDADISTGENNRGKYNVFVELERNRRLPEHIQKILDDVTKLTGIEEWKYRYYKDVESKPFTEESVIPTDKDSYNTFIETFKQDELDRFFNKGATDQKYISDNRIEFKRYASGNVVMEVVDEDTTENITNKYTGISLLDEDSVSEMLWLTKFFGNYNIYKIDENLFFTNGVRTKVLKRI